MTHSDALLAPADENADERLVSLAMAGNQDAFRLLVERHYRLVINIAYRALGDSSLAEDVAQEVFLKVYRKLPSYRQEKPFLHWLHRVAANTVTDAVRSRRQPLSLDLQPDVTAGPAGDPERLAAGRELERAVRRAVAELPVPFREPITLLAFHDLSYQQIADVLEIPLGTVMSRLYRAKRLLRGRLAGLISEPESQAGPGNNP